MELVDLYDPALVFEPIHRVVFGVEPAALLARMREALSPDGVPAGAQSFRVVMARGEERFQVGLPASPLAVGTLQRFLDQDLAAHPGGSIDYIHGEADLRGLVADREDAVGFLLPPMPKEDLFPSVLADGALPRKTFSMGNARDKRYYLECRKIRI